MTTWMTCRENAAYEVSDDGKVRRADTGRALKTPINRAGYMVCNIGHGNTRYVHRLMLEAFRGLPDGRPIARHLNDVRADNRLENLAWGTQADNTADAFRNLGVKRFTHRLTEDQVRDIKHSGMHYKDAALKHGCTESNVFKIRRGISWEAA